METRSQKYNGENPYNNRVLIDYEKKLVVFDPMTQGGIIRYYMEFLLNLIVKGMLIWGILMYIIWGITAILKIEMTEKYVIIPMIILLTISISISLLYWNKKWRHNCYPKFNHAISLTKNKEKTFNKDALVDNKAIIPNFSNVMIQYKATKDFGKQLKEIKIINRYNENAYDWLAIFTFKKTPQNGELKIKYN